MKRAAVCVTLLVVKPNLWGGELSLRVVWIPLSLASRGCARCLIIQVDNAGAMALLPNISLRRRSLPSLTD
jgi:hypothetical protein